MCTHGRHRPKGPERTGKRVRWRTRRQADCRALQRIFTHDAGPDDLGAGTLGDGYGITTLPLTLLIDRRGRVAESHLGMVDKVDWERKIQALLREQPR